MGKKLSNLEITDFCEQMAMILKSGISAYEGVEIMLEDAKDISSKQILTTMRDDLKEGKTFYEAVEDTRVFPLYAAKMIRIGEESGRLDEVMTALVAYYEREEGISKAIKNALTYPIIMIVIMVVVVVVLLAKVLPVFEQVFEMLGTQMSGISKSFLNIGTAFGKYAAIFIIIVAAVIALIIIFTKTEKGRNGFKNSFGKFGPLKKVYEKIAAGRFASGMALTMKSGLDVDESVKLVGDMIDLHTMKGKIDKLRAAIAEGVSFAEALSKNNIFSKVYAKMVMIGFKTGSTDSVMDKIAENYEKDIDDSISRTISIIEPTIVAVFAIVVGLILLSVMLPLLSVMTGMM